MRTKRKILICASLTSFLVSSCDPWHQKDYYVENKLTQDIEVIITVGKTDSTLLVKSKQNKLIFDYGYVYGTVGVDDDRYNDNLTDFRIKTKDTIISIDESKWKFEKLEKYHAVYTMEIDTSIF